MWWIVIVIVVVLALFLEWFRRKYALFKPEQAEEPQEVKPALQEKRLARLVRTSRGGPNMPRYQPCSQCHGGSKRQEKLGELGASYFCRRDQVSFVVRCR